MPDYIVRLLGPVQVTWEAGEPPRFRSQRTMALLGYLAAEGRPVARDTLAALFWPDATASKGKANLRRELHNLGNILPGCWQSDRQTVRFAPEGGARVDVYQLLRLEQVEQCVDAAELVRGDFLEGVLLDDNLEFETWLLGERERWRQRAERVLSEAVRAQEESGDYDEALRFARRLLQLLPWHEETHRKVMRLLALSGQRSAALKQFELCRQVLREELGVEVSAETQALYERIRDSLTFALHNIPAPTTSLIGRKDELAQLEAWLLEGEARLITITGAGGMGKTRLALGLAQALLERPGQPFTNGVYFVSLASVDDPAHLISEIAAVLHFPLRGQDRRSPRQQLLDYLRQKQMLLLLDNFEHLLPGADLITDILEAAPSVKILVTSRERLRLQAEQTLPLHGLVYEGEMALPDTITGKTAAARLFMTVAGRVHPDFSVRDEEQFQLSRICSLVEGMPLALELAATWAETLSLAAIADEIEEGLDILETEVRDIPERHRSIRAVFDTSWQRLSPQEQEIFVRLSVFHGGFTQDAAEVVAGATVGELRRLMERSLLSRGEGGRYQIHEVLRQFAAGQLASRDAVETAGGDQDNLRRTIFSEHLDYFLSLAEQGERELRGCEALAWLDRLRAEHANILSAIAHGLEADPIAAARLASAMWLYWFIHSRTLEGRKQYELVLTRKDCLPREVYAWVLNGYGAMLWVEGEMAEAHVCAEEALQFFQADENAEGIALSLHHLAFVQDFDGSYERARNLREEGLRHARTLADSWATIVLLESLADQLTREGKLAEARQMMLEAMPLCRERGDRWLTLYGHGMLAGIAQMQGDYEAVRDRAVQILPEAAALGDVRFMAWTRITLGKSAMQAEKWAEAASHLEEALHLSQEAGDVAIMADSYLALADAANGQANHERAAVLYNNALANYCQVGHVVGQAEALDRLGRTALLRGRDHEAVRLHAAGTALRMQAELPRPKDEENRYQRQLEMAEGRLPADEYDSAWREGGQLSPADVAYGQSAMS